MLDKVDVFVINYGLHYPEFDEFKTAMLQMFDRLEKWAGEKPGRRVLMREINTQHFPGTAAFASFDQVGGT